MPYIGEIRLFAGNFPPAGWEFCQGQSIPISENDTLFTLIGTTYGGDGQESFNLPNLASRVPMHQGTGPDGVTYQIGEMAGVESVTLSLQQIPSHTHAQLASTAAGTMQGPTGGVPARPVSVQPNVSLYTSGGTTVNTQPTLGGGGNQPHENCQPFVGLNYIISMYGIFPSQT